MKTTANHILFNDERSIVTKFVICDQPDGKNYIVRKKGARVTIFGYDVIKIHYQENEHREVTQALYDVSGGNQLITLLDFFERGLVKKGARDFAVGELTIRATTAVKGSENLCLTLMVDSNTPSTTAPIYFTPAEAANLQRCIYHVVSFLARV